MDDTWIRTVDSRFIRANTVAALDVVDDRLARQDEDEPRSGIPTSFAVRGLVVNSGKEPTWHDLVIGIDRHEEAFKILRELVTALAEAAEGRAAATVVSYDHKHDMWTW